MFYLTDALWFPDPSEAEADGLLAVGGDLSAERLLLAYQMGIFPWFMDNEVIFWYSPPQRMVLFPEEVHISRSMKKVLRSGRFHFTKNRAFEKVIRQCAAVQAAKHHGTWISDAFIEAYVNLYRLGLAHSFECWQENDLAGGLYGVQVGSILCGESMFSLKPNTSKAILIDVCSNSNYSVIDCQVENNHLLSMGARNISREHYLNLLPVHRAFVNKHLNSSQKINASAKEQAKKGKE